MSRELALLPRLRKLDIGGLSSRITKRSKPTGELRDLIDNLSQLSHLESLSLLGVWLEMVPNSIRSLKQLRTLEIYHAGLRALPDWLGELEQLHSLRLGFNELTALPDSLTSLFKLQIIDLGNNRFTEIPEVISRLGSLKHLDIRHTAGHLYTGSIKHVPASILQLPRLERVNVDGHLIETPPPEVVKEGVEAIKNYWRQQQEVGIDYLSEAKLIIVGEAGAGKTTLAKKIEDSDYALKPQEPSTEGVDVLRWSFPFGLRVERSGREEILPTDFKVNIWDFGGQEIYHATHQFFLTRRSVYALVADNRKEDTDFNYWLQVVELLSDRSPLLIVQNEKQDRQREIDLGSLRADFPNLLGSLRINLATNRGLDELKRAIRQQLERLPHIGTPLPKTWSQVRSALEHDPRNYISLDEYLAICERNGFTRRDDKLQLSGYLHDLGICLHFQDDPVLKNTVILKPTWGTDAVYRVLDDHDIVDQRGRFDRPDLARIWCDEQYAAMRSELLHLMMRFQLCYQLPNVDAYIAPQLLSPTSPVYGWPTQDNLMLGYEYDFMPKGILTRFIVALNHLIADQSLVWKSGVILARQSARAEVIEDYPRRKITVRVSGAESSGLLAIVDDQLDRIHATFPRLKYEKFLPCNCEACHRRDEPYAYPLSELKDFAAQGDLIQCRVSRKLIDAARLIQNVLPSAVDTRDKLMRQPLLFPEEPQPSPESAPRKEVFVSYAWHDESTLIVDKLQEAFEGRDIELVRDKDEMRYKDSIRAFMERIGRGKCIVVVLSKQYFESKSCMFELTEIAARGDIHERVFPIVLQDAKIWDASDRLDYIEYWERKTHALDAKMKGVRGEYLQGIREELDLFAHIRNTIANIVNLLSDLNALTPEQHRGSNFSALLQALDERLLSDAKPATTRRGR